MPPDWLPHGKPGKDGPNPQLLSRLRDSERAIASARAGLISATRLDHALTAAAEWLLDNFYLVRTHGAEVRNHLPRHYARILPTLPSLQGQLRVAVLAAELVKRTDLTLDEASIIGWLRGYQKVDPLTIAELWAFPLLLRLALIEVLAQLASRIGEAQQLREAGYLWANRLANGARQGTKVFSKMVSELESQPISLRPQFVTCLAEQLQGDENALVPAQRWLEDRLETRLIDLVSTEHIQEAAERVSIANAFRSLRTLSQIDFTCIFEEVSLVEEELRKDPAGTYSHCDFATRDQCRRAVELISRRSHLGQVEISRKAVELAAIADEPRFRHVVYYLLGDGAGRLESVTHVRLPVQQKFLRAVKRNATAAYLGGILSLTAVPNFFMFSTWRSM